MKDENRHAQRAHLLPFFGLPPSVLNLRWGPCWYGQAAVNRRDAGSIPATAAFNFRALGRAAEVPAFQAGQAGSTPAGHFRRAEDGGRRAEKMKTER